MGLTVVEVIAMRVQPSLGADRTQPERRTTIGLVSFVLIIGGGFLGLVAPLALALAVGVAGMGTMLLVGLVTTLVSVSRSLRRRSGMLDRSGGCDVEQAPHH